MCIFLILIIQTVCTAEVSIDTVDASQLNGNAPAIITVNEVEGASPARGSQILDTQSVSGRNGNILKPKIVVALTQSEIFNLKMKLALGSGIQIIGLGMNVGGTIMAFSDHENYRQTSLWIGVLTLLAGIPVNGIGANMMTRSVNALGQDSLVRVPGWGLYQSSWGCLAIGGGLLALAAIPGSDGGSDSDAKLAAVSGGILVCLGVLAHGMALYQFTASGIRAHNAYGNLKLSVSPSVIPISEGSLAPGLQVALKF
jgi:hypothetical protein